MLATEKTVFLGAEIQTMSEALPKAEAVCVCNGRIDCVGTRMDVLRRAGTQGTHVVDLGGGTLYPGFIDTHSHLSSYSNYLDWARCGVEAGSVHGVLEALRQRAATHPHEWIFGYGYDDTGLPEGRHLNRHDLDAVSSQRPVFVSHISIHMGYANSRALELLGYAHGADIPGGTVVMDDAGQPTGFLQENAYFEALRALPQPRPESIQTNMRRAVAEYTAKGFTTFQDGGIGINGGAREYLNAYMEMSRQGALDARAYLQLLPCEMDRLLEYGIQNFGSDFLRLGGVKCFADGSIQGFTAALREGYHSRPDFHGALLCSASDLEEQVLRYHRQNVQVAVHANGDAAAETVIHAFEQAVAAYPRTDLRHMLIHAQVISDDQLARLHACGVIPTFFSRHVEVWGDRHSTLFLGPRRAARLDPAASAVKLGMPFGLHVDTPVLPPTALGSMHAAVNRITSAGLPLGPEQRIDAHTALRAYTDYAALCCGGEHDRGRIEPGRYADFVLLEKNILEADPSDLRSIKVRATICGGRMVHEA